MKRLTLTLSSPFVMWQVRLKPDSKPTVTNHVTDVLRGSLDVQSHDFCNLSNDFRNPESATQFNERRKQMNTNSRSIFKKLALALVLTSCALASSDRKSV